jgi:hypothetical protein
MSAPAIERLLPYEAVLLRRTYDGPKDDYGNPTWSEIEIPTRVELQQIGSREEQDGAVQITLWRTWLPPTVPADGWDRLRVLTGPLAGRIFELELTGDANPAAPARDGVPHHYEVTVRAER